MLLSSSSSEAASHRGAGSSGAANYAGAAAGDDSVGEDLVVRRAAVDALERFNGSIVVADAESGRILTMVNQKLALSNGSIPCSTIKLVAAFAGLNEGIVRPGEKVWFDGSWYMTMVQGLAISNNVYFAHLGKQLGFARFKRYANLFGFGEKAGWNISGEQPGRFSSKEHSMGVGRMSSFGTGISVTPLQMAAFVSAMANGGTLYYLQTPRTREEIENFRAYPKRHLPIRPWLPEVENGLSEAVRRGTGREAFTAYRHIRGKTGTCTERGPSGSTRVGWFASYSTGRGRKLAVVVMLRGSAASGPRASEIAGRIYRSLSSRDYFRRDGAPKVIELTQSDGSAPAHRPAAARAAADGGEPEPKPRFRRPTIDRTGTGSHGISIANLSFDPAHAREQPKRADSGVNPGDECAPEVGCVVSADAGFSEIVAGTLRRGFSELRLSSRTEPAITDQSAADSLLR